MNWLGLIHLNCQERIPVERAWIDELADRLRDTPFAPGDRNVLYSLKEMSIAHTICLDRQEVDRLFAAAVANPGVSTEVRSMLLSWHADYLWLHENDLVAARLALGKSLALMPLNPSNRLKWAQLKLISGEREAAQTLLRDLQGERLSVEERKTLNELIASSSMLRGSGTEQAR